MERGDIVVCVDDAGAQEYIKKQNYYTVREFIPEGAVNKATGYPWRGDDKSGAVLLEEVVVYYDHCPWEIPFRGSRFRKVDAMDLTALLEEKEAEYVF